MNTVFLQGRVPFQPNFFEAKGEKKAFATFMLAVNTGVKDDETGYYKEDMFKCSTFGAWAENLNKNWNNRHVIDIVAKLVIGQDYQNKDGELVKGSPELKVSAIHEYNTLSKTITRAKIPNFDNAIMYKAADGDKKSFMSIKLAESTGVKDENGYYKERIITAKAFGNTADFLDKYYKAGDIVTVEGRYADAQDYQNKDGELVKAMPELLIEAVHGFPKRKEDSGDREASQNKSENAPARKAPTTSAPKAGLPKANAPKIGGVKSGLPKIGGIKKLGK